MKRASLPLTSSALAGLLALAAVPCAAQEPAPTAAAEAPNRIARLSYVEGKVLLAVPAGAPASESESASELRGRAETAAEQWEAAVVNRPIASGDRISIPGQGRAELQAGTATIHLDQHTRFELVQLDDDVIHASLREGGAALRVRQLGERELIQIETPNTTVYLRQTGEYHIQADAAGNRTVVKTRSGEAEVIGKAQSHTVRANEQGAFIGAEQVTAQISPLGPRTAFESWANERDRREEDSRSSRYVSREVIGYEDLDDYGEWLHEPGYGHVWRPVHVHAGWAPYAYGHWARIGPWGWTWVDNASWGFAPFHYGSWVSIRNRWCWVPGPRRVHFYGRRPFYGYPVHVNDHRYYDSRYFDRDWDRRWTDRDPRYWRDNRPPRSLLPDRPGIRPRLPPSSYTPPSNYVPKENRSDFRRPHPSTRAGDIKRPERSLGRDRVEIMRAEGAPARAVQPAPSHAPRAAPQRSGGGGRKEGGAGSRPVQSHRER